MLYFSVEGGEFRKRSGQRVSCSDGRPAHSLGKISIAVAHFLLIRATMIPYRILLRKAYRFTRLAFVIRGFYIWNSSGVYSLDCLSALLLCLGEVAPLHFSWNQYLFLDNCGWSMEFLRSQAVL